MAEKRSCRHRVLWVAALLSLVAAACSGEDFGTNAQPAVSAAPTTTTSTPATSSAPTSTPTTTTAPAANVLPSIPYLPFDGEPITARQARLTGVLKVSDGCLIVDAGARYFFLPYFAEGSVYWLGEDAVLADGSMIRVGDEVVTEGNEMSLERLARDAVGLPANYQSCGARTGWRASSISVAGVDASNPLLEQYEELRADLEDQLAAAKRRLAGHEPAAGDEYATTVEEISRLQAALNALNLQVSAVGLSRASD